MDREQTPARRREKDDTDPSSFSLRWTSIVNALRKPVHDRLHCTTRYAARRPVCTIGFIIMSSVCLLVIGSVTNFTIDTETDLLWTPQGSKPVQHRRWIDDQSGFPVEKRTFLMFFHNHGKNIVLDGEKNNSNNNNNIARAFEALDAVRNGTGYEEMCRGGDYADTRTQQQKQQQQQHHSCEVWGVTKFWNDTERTYRNDDRIILTMSAQYFPDDGSRVDRNSLFGYPRFDGNGTLVSAESFVVIIHFPNTEEAEGFEELAINLIVALDDTWQSNDNIDLRVQVEAYRSFDDE